MDFGFLPPEVNSGRMYAGPGSGSLLAAAGSWDSLAAELSITAAVYESVLSGLTGLSWYGPASQAMAASAAPYVGWLHATAERAQQTGIQARAAAAAYELARAMTVPPPAVAANRTQLATLVATNFFGQNTAAIAANEAQYAEYWAQDASAMYSYSASSAATVQFSPFSAPREATTQDGVTAQQDAVTQATANAANSNAGPGSQLFAFSRRDGFARILDTIQGAQVAFRSIFTAEGFNAGIIQADKNLGILPNLAAVPAALPKAPALSGAASGLGNVNAVLARAGRIGPMSVPAGWAAAAGDPVPALPGGGLSGLPATEALARTGPAAAGVPGIPGGTVRRAPLVVPRYGVRITVMTRPPAAG
ncbi:MULTISPECIES: PPE family protein [Mycobacterium]|uniref:PPE family protein n=3 Tax=Mycobacterium intracellulare TaxID=1767 RepID=J9WFC2_MYCIP|nr:MULTISPECIES: PPE family protein [Mycobacterium]AFS15934.1 PPE family protein [Mycobacterium intracellulare subsp. intracellulare MTCC 9506]ASW96857.1 PPE family protein [Mycobacterium intracellulare]MCA2233185.1 PPE family protein [Mycobacterium intracellulare]MCA2248358.1 PPE family protein [Mycobacterium intracellulare]MCA2254654.1 PPE family protein [Mycobacterium intracellulare]